MAQGILSAWTLSEFSGQCNEVSDTEADWNSEDLFNGNYVNTSEVHSVNCTDSSDYGEIPNNDEENVKSKDISKTIETSLIDPDAEWITSKFIDVPTALFNQTSGFIKILFELFILECYRLKRLLKK